ncbi:hypothetical protein SSS_10444 [Sarcoptes scabiei]|uniref:Uncharacterized protein n=1 Tax=Sarcoptes scabiei TaxID=52283 RepID=A0A834RBA5_SARSC|nr:hypothetical protein SSS_10444 [Sarcoptes scabiei]
MKSIVWVLLAAIFSSTISSTFAQIKGRLAKRDISIPNIGKMSIEIADRSKYTNANVYEILAVTMLATLGSLMMPYFNTLMTYLVTSNRLIAEQSKETKWMNLLGQNRIQSNSSKIIKSLSILMLTIPLSPSNAALQGSERDNSTIISSTSTISQLADKLMSKLKAHLLSQKPAQSRGYYDYSYLDSYASDIQGKSDYSWIVPLIIVIGFGTLLIPLLGTLMTTMMTQGTINLTAGKRRKRRSTDFINDLWVF